MVSRLAGPSVEPRGRMGSLTASRKAALSACQQLRQPLPARSHFLRASESGYLRDDH